MAKGCILPVAANNFKKAVRSGKIKMSTLYELSSKERVALLEKYVGNSAKLLNASLEKSLLSPNQKLAMRNWIYKYIGEGKPLYKDVTLEQAKQMRENLKISDLRIMETEARLKELEKYVGPKQAQVLNERFEYLKKTGNLQIWEEKAMGSSIYKQEKKLKGALARLETLDDLGVLRPAELENFMESFVEIELGVSLTAEESIELSKLIEKERAAFDKLIKSNDWTYTNEKEIVDYLDKLRKLEDYIESLKETTKADIFNQAIDYARASILASPRILKNSFIYQSIPAIERAITKRIVSGNFSDGDLNSNFMEKIMAKFSAIKLDAETAEFIKNQTAMAVRIYHKTGYDISRMQTLHDGYKFFGEDVARLQGKTLLGKWAKFVNLAPKWFAGGSDMLFANIGRADTSTMMAREIAKMEAIKGKLPSGMTEKERAMQLLKESYSFDPKIEQAQKIRELAILDAHMMNGTQKDGLSDWVVRFRDNLKLGKLKFGKMIIPFAKIPSTVVSEGLQTATGVGIIRSLSGIQKASKMEGIERSTQMQKSVGMLVRYTGLLGATILLASLLDDDDYIAPYDILSYSEYQLARARGAGSGYVRIGGKWMQLRYLPMVSIPLSAIMIARQASQKGGNAVVGYFAGIITSFLETPGIKETKEILVNLTKATSSTEIEDILNTTKLDGKSIVEWAKVRALPSVISYDLWNAIFPPDTKYDFLGREIEKSGIIGIVKDDKTNDIIMEYNELNKTGNMPIISNPTGEYARELREKLGDKEYFEKLAELQADYADRVSREIKSSAYKRKSPEDKKESLDKIREITILDKLKILNKKTK